MHPYISLFGMDIPAYGVCMSTGIIVSFCVSYIRTKKEKLDINSLFVVAAIGVGGGLLGSKVAYIFATYGAENVWRAILRGNFSFLTEGGLVFYGGLIGGVIGGILGVFVAGEGKNLNAFCNLVIPSVPLAHVFGRLGCYFAGCCYGIPYDGICAVNLKIGGSYKNVFPTQLLEALLNFFIFIILLIYSEKKRDGYKTLSVYLIMYSIVRFLVEMLRGDEIRGKISILSTSQFISIILLVFGVLMYMFLYYKEKRKKSNFW